jgi:hypothetical protein
MPLNPAAAAITSTLVLEAIDSIITIGELFRLGPAKSRR